MHVRHEEAARFNGPHTPQRFRSRHKGKRAHNTAKQYAAALASRHFRISRAFLHLAAPWALHTTPFYNHFPLTFSLTSDRQLRRKPDAHGQVSAEQPPGALRLSDCCEESLGPSSRCACVTALQVSTGSMESTVHTLSSKLDLLMLTVMAQANKDQRSARARARASKAFVTPPPGAGASDWRRRVRLLRPSKAMRCWMPCIPTHCCLIDGRSML